MREIKLRIRLKSKYKDEYCTIFNSVFDKNIGIAFYPINKEEWDIISADEFTGLHDKNGKEIYEGDIIKVIEISDTQEKEYITDVIFCESAFCVKSRNNDYDTFLSSWYNIENRYPLIEYEIIGTTYTKIRS